MITIAMSTTSQSTLESLAIDRLGKAFDPWKFLLREIVVSNLLHGRFFVKLAFSHPAFSCWPTLAYSAQLRAEPARDSSKSTGCMSSSADPVCSLTIPRLIPTHFAH
jgi:hypothetical protein